MSERDESCLHDDGLISKKSAALKAALKIQKERSLGNSDGWLNFVQTMKYISSHREEILHKQDGDILSKIQKLCEYANNSAFFGIHKIDLQSHSVEYYEGIMQTYKREAIISSIFMEELLNFLCFLTGKKKAYYDSGLKLDELERIIAKITEKLSKMLAAAHDGKQAKAKQREEALKPYYDRISAGVAGNGKLLGVIAEVFEDAKKEGLFEEDADMEALRSAYLRYRRKMKKHNSVAD